MIESHLADWETTQISIFLMADWLKVPYLGLICRSLTSSSEDVFRNDPINPLFQAFLVGGVSPFGTLPSVITKPAAVMFTQLRLPSGTCWNLSVVVSQPSWGLTTEVMAGGEEFISSLPTDITHAHLVSDMTLLTIKGFRWRACHCCLRMQMACC